MGTQPSARPILLIEDDPTLGRLLAMQLEAAGYPVVLAATGAQGLALAEEKDPAAIVLDVRLPDRDGIELVEQLRELAPVIVLTAFGSIDQAVSAIKRGAHDYLVKPVAPEALLLAIERALEKVDFQRTYALLRREAASAVHTELLGNSEAIRRLRRAIRLVAPTDATVLLLGESGTGKELAARAIHAASPRRERPFVVVDCTTLQDTLFESELFGHEKGAFTDADRRKEGLIEAAEGGTVFLDEIGDLSPAAQAKFLRTLETRTFRRLGSTRDCRCDVRFIAATNRALARMVREGRFREDLYYRLEGLVLSLPPLRERPEDVPLLAEFFLSRRSAYRHVPKRFTPAALEALQRYGWPGNVRELRNIVERAAILSGESPLIEPGHLALRTSAEAADRAGGTFRLAFDHEPMLDEIRDTYIAELLRRHGGHRATVARVLGISERTLYRLLQQRRGPEAEAGAPDREAGEQDISAPAAGTSASASR